MPAVAAVVTPPGLVHYGASKAGLNAMSQSLAKRLARHNITVGVVAPGFVDTDMAARYRGTPMWDDITSQSPFGRIAKPEEVAAEVPDTAPETEEKVKEEKGKKGKKGKSCKVKEQILTCKNSRVP